MVLATAAATLVAGAVGAAPVPADAAVSSTVVVAMPGPGHSETWATSVTNPSAHPSTVYLTVTGVGGSAVNFGGLLSADVVVGSGKVVVPATPLSALLGKAPVRLGIVAPGSAVRIGGDVTLDRSAGDALQGLGASIVFGLTSAEQQAPLPPGGLAPTGLAITGAALAAALIAAGALLTLIRRNRRSRS